MSHFESFIYRRWHHDSEFSLQTVSWHGFPRTDVVSQQHQSTAQQQSECRRWRPVRISAPQRSLPPLPWRFSLRISTFYHQSCGTQSRNSQAWMQKLQLQPTTSHDWIKYIHSLIVSWKEYVYMYLKWSSTIICGRNFINGSSTSKKKVLTHSSASTYLK